jgi:LmbE family N-acetylglucosaminyl deacetylase
VAERWIYISPHLDDAVFSCGGRLFQQVQAGCAVEVWTLCAGDPPAGELSRSAARFAGQAGRTIVATRRAEDLRACASLGVVARHFSMPDCIFRRHPQSGAPLYPSLESIFGERQSVEKPRWEALGRELEQHLPADAQLVFPMAIGNHVDHQFARGLAQQLGRSRWLYADVPYVLENPAALAPALSGGCTRVELELSDKAMQAWVRAAFEYGSQVGFWWQSPEELRQALEGLRPAALWQWPG